MERVHAYYSGVCMYALSYYVCTVHVLYMYCTCTLLFWSTSIVYHLSFTVTKESHHNPYETPLCNYVTHNIVQYVALLSQYY